MMACTAAENACLYGAHEAPLVSTVPPPTSDRGMQAPVRKQHSPGSVLGWCHLGQERGLAEALGHDTAAGALALCSINADGIA